MASEIHDILFQFLNTIGNEIKNDIPSVSGKTQSSIEVDVTESTQGGFIGARGYLRAVHYIYTFEFGRGPTKNTTAHTPTLRQAILQWIEMKNIRFTRTIHKGNKSIIRVITAEQMSWMIAIKIHNEGNRLFRQLRGGSTGVISNKITDRRIDAFVKVFASKHGRVLLQQTLKQMNLNSPLQ